MNLSYEWLRAFVPFDQSAAELRDLLTAHVVTVDELVALRGDLAAFVVARVVEEAPHPDSDHLHVTKVDMGTGELLDVVCGAPNVTAGRLYPFAPTGTVMPSGLKIQKRRIRGAISDGMLCSARELGLGDEQDGILELTIDVAPGTPLLRALPLGDMRLSSTSAPIGPTFSRTWASRARSPGSRASRSRFLRSTDCPPPCRRPSRRRPPEPPAASRYASTSQLSSTASWER